MQKPMLRALTAVFGIIAVGWAIGVIPIYSREEPLADTAKAIISGDKFNLKQLAAIRSTIDNAPANLVGAKASSAAAIVRSFLLEEQFRSGNREVSVSDYSRIQQSVSAALGRSPADSFMWLTAFWLKRLRSESVTNDLNLLRMSYWSGPNEGWIAIKRIPLALEVLGSLPPDLADKALSDFVELVRSGFYAEAAAVLEGPGWSARNQLLGKLVAIDLSDRRAFAKVLTARGVEGASVPGVQPEAPRPF